MVRPGEEIGPYRIVSELATGGMGQVWIAEHSLLRRRVAIKVLRPELSERRDLLERFFDEARAAAQVDDAGIVAVHDVGHHAGSAYIVMEHLAGEVLATRMHRLGRLPIAVATRLTTYAAMTMAVAHARGIVHRDLKPDNLFVVSDPAVIGGERVKILDFGIAKLLVEHDVAVRTQTGAILGTPMYMSPEQCRSAGTVDHRTDIYALGCVLFHMVCGRPPFVGESSGDLIASHIVDEPPVASSLCESVPSALDAVIARCLSKLPDTRFGSMTELARALAPFAELAVAIPTLTPARASGAMAAAAAGRVDAVGFLTTLGTGIGEARPAPHSHARTWVAISAAIALAAVVTIGVVMRTGGSDEIAIDAPAAIAPASIPAPARPEPEQRAPPAPAAVAQPTAVLPPPPAKPAAKQPHAKPAQAPRATTKDSAAHRDNGAYDF